LTLEIYELLFHPYIYLLIFFTYSYLFVLFIKIP